MDKLKLLKAIYESIQWDRLYELLPEAERDEVDLLFRELRQNLEPEPEEGLADEIAGGEAVLHCDGASKGNPGPAGIGMVLETADGREVLAWGRAIGKATNNVAEYRALIAGLQQALELGVRRITVQSDSQLMVRQINGQYKVKNAGLQPLHAEAKSLLKRFDEWSIQHVPREENAHADSLADRHAKKGK